MKAPNYAEIWHEALTQNGTSSNQYESPASAQSYDASGKIWEDGYLRAEQFPFTSDDTVLDIGCGPGVLAVPLSNKVKHVTVVEPSAAMLELLDRHCAEKDVRNITKYHSDWEHMDLEALPDFDYVIASYSLAMPAMKEAMIRMNRKARKRVYLYWFCGMASWEKIQADLLPVVYGREHPYRPKTDILYGILCQLGISADVTHLEGTMFDYLYENTDAAVANLRKRLNVSDERFDDVFLRYLHESPLFRQEGEQWHFLDQTNYVCISWKPKELL